MQKENNNIFMISDLIIRIELLSSLILENDWLDNEFHLTSDNITILVKVKTLAKEIRTLDEKDDIKASEKLLQNIKNIKKLLWALKYLPEKHKEVHYELKVKVQQCLEALIN